MELKIAEVSLPRSRTSPSQPYLPNPPCGRCGSLHRSKPVANEILDLGPQVPTLECKNLRLRPTKARPRACRDIAPSALELSVVPYQPKHACRPRCRQPFMGSRPNVLSCSSVRRDQIWFCEKDTTGGSHLFPLSDFKVRSTDKFENGYLEGRFGAIPFSGNLRALVKATTK